MTLSSTPDAADINAVTGQEIAATDQLGRSDIKKNRSMPVAAHAVLWIVIGYILALVIIAAWPLTLLMINGGNQPLNGY